MNLKDTALEARRKQAIEAIVADSTTLERLLKAGDFDIVCYHLRHHAQLAQDVVNLLPVVEATTAAKPDRLTEALRTMIRRELTDLFGKAAKGE